MKNWHTLEKSEQRELKLLRKLEKIARYEEELKKLKDQNKKLVEENSRLRSLAESGQMELLMPSSVQPHLRKPIPPFTQFLREQYTILRSEKGKQLPFCECSKQIAKRWHELTDEQRAPYMVRNMSFEFSS